MSLELDREQIPGYHPPLWADFIRLTCDFCQTKSPWSEGGGDLRDWAHLLGLDCCPDCSADFYESRNLR